MILHTISSSTKSLEVSIDHYKMVFPVEVNEESGKSIWKNRVESWKEKDKKKKKKKKSVPKAENEAPIPPEQQMEEIQ